MIRFYREKFWFGESGEPIDAIYGRRQIGKAQDFREIV